MNLDKLLSMTKKSTLLGAGPMSKNCVDAAINIANESGELKRDNSVREIPIRIGNPIKNIVSNFLKNIKLNINNMSEEDIKDIIQVAFE